MSRAERRAKARAKAKRRQELERRHRQNPPLLPPRVSRILSLSLIAVVVLGLGTWGVWSGLAGRAAATRVLKVVNGENITQGELTRRANVLRFLSGIASPLDEQTTAFLLDGLVDERLIAAEAGRRGLDVTDEELQQDMDKVVESLKTLYGSVLKVTVQRLRLGVSEADVVAYERITLIKNKLYQAVTADAEVTEQDIQDLYQKQKETLDKQGLSLEDARDKLTADALQAKKEEIYAGFLDSLRAQATIANP